MIRRSAAFAALVGLVVAPPLVLLAIGFRDWATLSLTGVTDIRLLLALLTVVGWVAWVGWVAAVVLELVALLAGDRGRPQRAAPQPAGWAVVAGPRALAAALLAAAFVAQVTPLASGAPGDGAGTATPGGGRLPLAGTVSDAPDASARAEGRAAGGGARQDLGQTAGDATDAELSTGSEVSRTDALVARGPSGARASRATIHTVRPGDDLWSLGARYYGDGAQWRQIVAANPSLGTDPLADLTPGMQLTIAEPVTLVTVRAGDTLSKLALRHLGEADRWPEIHALNRDRVADPDMIDIGWVLRVPLLLAAEGVAGSPAPATAEQSVDTPVDQPADPPADPPVDPLAETQGDSAQDADPSGSENHASGDGMAEGEEGAASPDVSVPPTASADSGAPARPTPPVQSTVPTADTLAPEHDQRAIARLVGGLTTLTASAVLGGLALRRRWQEASRPLGRRIAPPEAELTRFESALGLVPDHHEPDREDLIERAMRHLARHWWQQGLLAPVLAEVVVGPDDGEFRFVSDPGSAPPGFQKVGDRLAVTWAALRELDDPPHPVAYPALVTLGEDVGENLVMVDLVASGTLGVRSEGATLASEALSAMLVELACAPWSAELQLLVVTDDEAFTHVAGTHRVRTTTDAEAAVVEVERMAHARQGLLGDEAWDRVRLDPDRADAWAPWVVLFEVRPSPAHVARIQAATEGTAVGLAAALPVGAEAGQATWELTENEEGRGVLAGERSLVPQTLPSATRAAISSLYALADSTLTHPAPWWSSDDPEEPVNIVQLHPRPADTHAPRVLLLGPLDLVGATGEAPTRSTRACVEYCAWLVEHPGATPSHMSTDLFVTDGTRRSNLSRLRAWLGSDPDGRPYLPEAYSGHMRLHPEVTSDWRDMLTLTRGGVNTMSLERLKAALTLVRGAPLADAAPGQWGWAEHLRSEMAALIRDLGVVTARLAREKGDLDAARWAANRALMAAPDDELLLGERIRAEQAAGRYDEVERLVGRLHRQSRLLGVDLLDETVDLIQETVEGRLRAREA
ncbi:LysM peptidoglycan-binding domain-containing protein [Propioniciclava soli]|uniref:LysM peptidoglycan-binding domain-containing protein n=1 Tax=Propioniciclava soli TaxID=2775081 RepID=A0ABZ3C6G9_9ACTN